MVKDTNIYSTQSYCNEFLGFCPITNGNEDELRDILDDEGYENLWDYPLDEIEHIVENELDVVLVDVSFINDDGEIETVYRWFQIPSKED